MRTDIFLAMLVAFAAAVIICPLLIRLLRRLQFGQQIREDGPLRHRTKAGTPTMGGVVFLLASLIALFAVGRSFPAELWMLLFVTIGSALIGWLDDFAKVSRNRSLGLTARKKLLGQVLIAAAFTVALSFSGGYSSEITVPFFNFSADLSWFYPVFIFLIIIGTTNGVNLTDGIDGLASGTVIIALLAFLYIAVTSAMPEVALYLGALVGGCFGFLVYNLHPARIFMGDVGSLGLGGALAAAAILTKTELILVIIGGVFVLETISVILQVISFQLTGRRIFLMTPLHHHFELRGWSEWQVVTGFWGFAFIFSVLGLIQFWREFL